VNRSQPQSTDGNVGGGGCQTGLDALGTAVGVGAVREAQDLAPSLTAASEFGADTVRTPPTPSAWPVATEKRVDS